VYPRRCHQSWMKSNRLQLNSSKTEVLWCAAPRHQHSIPDGSIQVCANDVKPAKSVRDLGIYIDSNMSMTTHVSRTVSSCFADLRYIRSIRRSVSQPVLLSLVTSLVLSRLDYDSVTLNGITRRLMGSLQSVFNAAARLVYNSRKYDRITQLLCDLHWLRVPGRIQFRLAVLLFPCRNQTAPEYLARDLQWADDDISRRRLRSATTHKLVVRRTRLRTIGDRAFGAAAPRVWNNLPTDVITATSVATFKQRLKTFLFTQSFDV